MNRNKTIVGIIALFIAISLHAQDTTWEVPDDQKGKTAPMMFTPDMEKAGAEVYLKNCKSCHGDVGKNNVAKLNPPPPDLASSLVSSETDGSLHYKIGHGKGLMPAFKNTLSNTDIWNVISYIRSFHKDYVQPKPSEAAAFAGKAIKLSMDYLADQGKFRIVAMGKEKEKDVPAEGVEVALFINRYFGKLKIGENKATNKEGEVFFEVPKKLPGNIEGDLQLEAKVVDSEKYGDAVANAEYKAGVPTDKPSLTAKRAMWNVRTKAPWWITLAYPLAVLGVFGTILYILLLLKKINTIGKKTSD